MRDATEQEWVMSHERAPKLDAADDEYLDATYYTAYAALPEEARSHQYLVVNEMLRRVDADIALLGMIADEPDPAMRVALEQRQSRARRVLGELAWTGMRNQVRRRMKRDGLTLDGRTNRRRPAGLLRVVS
jgi:hypothetical protein